MNLLLVAVEFEFDHWRCFRGRLDEKVPAGSNITLFTSANTTHSTVLNTDWRHGGAASSLNIIRNDLKSSNTVEVPKSYYESLLADISNKNMMLLGFAVLALMVACIGAIMTIRRGKK